MCVKLGASSITAFGKPLTEFTHDQLAALNAVKVNNSSTAPAAATTTGGASDILPFHAPFEYEQSRIAKVNEWFEMATAFMGLSIGEYIHFNMPDLTTVTTAASGDDDDGLEPGQIAWRTITALLKDKTAIREMLENNFQSMPSIDEDVEMSQELKNKFMAHTYKVLVSAIEHNAETIKDAFTEEAIQTAMTQLQIGSFAEMPEFLLQSEASSSPPPSRFNSDLFAEDNEEEVVVASMLIAGTNPDDTKKKKKTLWSRAKGWYDKQKVKRAEQEARRRETKLKTAQQEAALKLAQARAKAESLRNYRLSKKNRAKGLAPPPPTDAPPLPPDTTAMGQTEMQLNALLNAVHDNPIANLIGDLIVAESTNVDRVDNMLQIQFMAHIACSPTVIATTTRKESVTIIKKDKGQASEEEKSGEQPKKKEEALIGGDCVVRTIEEKRKLSVITPLHQPSPEKEESVAPGPTVEDVDAKVWSSTARLQSATIGAPLFGQELPALDAVDVIDTYMNNTAVGKTILAEQPEKKKKKKERKPLRDIVQSIASTHARAMMQEMQNKSLLTRTMTPVNIYLRATPFFLMCFLFTK